MNAHTIRLALGAVALVVLAGCGSSSETETASSAATTPPAESAASTPPSETKTPETAAPTTTPETPAATAGGEDAAGGPEVKGPKVEVEIDGGKSFTLQLDEANAPKTTAGIVALVNKGFYTGIRVHRVEDWVVQWGDPISKEGADAPGVGSGGTGKNLPFEAGKLSFVKGTLGMASTGAGTGGDCQIFVVKRDSTFLDRDYSAFGKVVKGLDVALNLQKGDKIASMKVVK